MEVRKLVIYPKDAQRITGKSEKYGRKLIRQIKERLMKEQHHFLSITEFCQFTELDPEDVVQYLKGQAFRYNSQIKRGVHLAIFPINFDYF
jgi:hypothetical protein